MQNEFEKQVQKKLDELDLVPSPPVWQSIEKQIRKDKDRRRIIFWLPLGVLLLGAGAWFLFNGEHDAGISKPVTATSQTQTNEQEKKASVENGIFDEGGGDEEPKLNSKPSGEPNSLQQNNTSEKVVVSSGNKPLSTTESGNTSSNVNVINSRQNAVAQQKYRDEKLTPANGTDQKQTVPVISNENKLVATGIMGAENKTVEKDKTAVDASVNTKKDSAKKKDTILKDVVITEKTDPPAAITAKSTSKKWKFGLMGGIGFSGEGTGIDLNTEKSMDQLSAGSAQPPPNLMGSIPGTPVNKELSFSLGFAVKKELSTRFALVSGLNFNYYSSSRDVGEQVQDSTLPAGIFISRFYLNSGQVANNVTSRYYFISLPVMMDWRFIASEPFHLQAGISIQQMISSDAIQYDPAKGIYYKDPSSLKKTQFFTNFNLGYEFSFRDKSSLMLGPSIQYGLNTLSEKENKHLFFAGIQAQYFFK